MIETQNNLHSFTEQTSEQLSLWSSKIFAAAQPGAVYSEPVVAGNYTIITASEVGAGGGFGSGVGLGRAIPKIQNPPDEEGSPSEQANSVGGGSGGGGGSSGRPVAIIIIGPDGVSIKPVFDLTKIALAGITAWTTMLAVLRRARKASKG